MKKSSLSPNSADAILDRYISDIAAYRPLSLQEETALAAEAAEGSSTALQTLVNANLRFVVSIARQYASTNPAVSMLDLISEGNVALLHAASRFKPSSTRDLAATAVYAIRAAMERLLAATAPTSNPDLDAHPFALPLAEPFLDGAQLDSALATLSPREQTILRASFGIARPQQTMRDLALDLHISRARVRQLRRRALRRLNRCLRQLPDNPADLIS